MANEFNLFANIDEFSSNDNNSFLELEKSNHDVVELPEVVDSKKTIVKSRKRRNTKTSKTKVEEIVDLNEIDEASAKVVSPGIGQKTAFKKLTKLKNNLETIVEPTYKNKLRTSASVALREAIETNRKRSKRSRMTPNAPQIECVDSYTSPTTLRQNITQDSLEDDDLSLSIKLKWEGTSKLEKIEFSLYKPFSELTEQLGTREQVDAKSFLLMVGNSMIKPDDTPHSIGYTLGKFISVRIVDNPNQYFAESMSSKENTIEIKIQSLQWKKPILCNIKLTDQFKVLAGMCSEKLKCRADKLRFKFDGDLLDVTSTPDDLDFEGGEVLDIIISD